MLFLTKTRLKRLFSPSLPRVEFFGKDLKFLKIITKCKRKLYSKKNISNITFQNSKDSSFVILKLVRN